MKWRISGAIGKIPALWIEFPGERAGYVPRPRDNIEEKKKIKAAIKSHNTDYRAGRWFLLFH